MAGNCCCRQGFPHEIFCGRRACVPHISDANLINNYLSRKILPQNLDILFIAPTWHAGQTVRTAYEFQVYVVFIISWRDKTSKYARNCRDARSVRPEKPVLIISDLSDAQTVRPYNLPRLLTANCSFTFLSV